MNPTRLVGIIAPFVLWYLAIDIAELVTPELLPSLSSVFAAFIDGLRYGAIIDDMQSTLYRWISGFLLGASFGLMLGFMIGHSSLLKELSNMSIEFMRALPVTALLPLFLLIFGVGDLSKIAMAALPSLLLLAIYTDGGIRRCSIARLEMATSFGASRWQAFRFVTIPEIAPSLLLGLRLALSLSLVVTIVSEMFIGTRYGLGQRIYEAYMLNSSDTLYVNILITGLIGYLSAASMQMIEQRSMFWVGK